MSKILEIILGIANPKVILASIFVAAIIFIISSNLTYTILVFFIIASFYGFFDFGYKEREIAIEKRRKGIPHTFIFNQFEITPNTLITQTIEDFKYEGFNFKVLVINKYPPNSLSYPLCPKCNSFLVESIQKKIPFRISIILKCNKCNISYKSKLTREELIKDVAQHFGII